MARIVALSPLGMLLTSLKNSKEGEKEQIGESQGGTVERVSVTPSQKD